MTMTKIPETPDFMPPEALSKRPVYGPPLDVFSYGGVALNVITQQWPEPSDLVQVNPNTGRREVVSEVMRRQPYLDKMTGLAADLKPLVMSCLDDEARDRPPVTRISTEIKRVKDVCSQQTGHDGISPIVWWAEVSGQSPSKQKQVKFRSAHVFCTSVIRIVKEICLREYFSQKVNRILYMIEVKRWIMFLLE